MVSESQKQTIQLFQEGKNIAEQLGKITKIEISPYRSTDIILYFDSGFELSFGHYFYTSGKKSKNGCYYVGKKINWTVANITIRLTAENDNLYQQTGNKVVKVHTHAKDGKNPLQTLENFAKRVTGLDITYSEITATPTLNKKA